MFCPNCGNRVDNDSSFCPSCGANLTTSQPQAPITQIDPASATPPNQNAATPAQNTAQPKPPAQPAPAQTNNDNTVAIVGFIFAFIMPIVGIICSIIGLNNAKTMNGKNRSLALAGLIISIVETVIGVIGFIIGIAVALSMPTDPNYYYYAVSALAALA